ncbi:MAG: Gfo/Idh/MocA family oxidoreductase [Pararhodobacter sp.]|nr:Gfo/Idh/MocA family oxidoreductase [Pararhodobacter sp.]
MSYQREFENRVKIGLVGLGSHSYRNILPSLTYLPVELVAVCDLDAGLAEKTARQYGVRDVYSDVDEMLEKADIEAVLVCVSPQVHPILATKAMKAGKHVWMEKPAAASVADVQMMLDARADRVCAVGYKKAFMPATRKAVELIGLAETGKVLSILGVYSMTIPLGDPGAPSKWLADGCHPMALMLQLGGSVDAVTTHRGAHGGGSLILHFASGAIGNFHLAHGTPPFQPHERYSVFTEHTAITIDNGATVTYQRGIPFNYTSGTTFAPPGTASGAVVWQAQNTMNTLENKAEFLQGNVAELADFCQAILTGGPLLAGTLESALEIAKIYEAALQSDGNRVELAA